MTDRLTPELLRDLADLDDSWLALKRATRWTAYLREEAARREAEAKRMDATERLTGQRLGPLTGIEAGPDAVHPKPPCDGLVPNPPYIGPGSAAAPKRIVPNHDGIGCKRGQGFDLPPEDKPAPAADDLISILRGRAISYDERNSGVKITLYDDATAAYFREAADRIEALMGSEQEWTEASLDWERVACAEKARADRLAAAIRDIDRACNMAEVHRIAVAALTSEGGDRG